MEESRVVFKPDSSPTSNKTEYFLKLVRLFGCYRFGRWAVVSDLSWSKDHKNKARWCNKNEGILAAMLSVEC